MTTNSFNLILECALKWFPQIVYTTHLKPRFSTGKKAKPFYSLILKLLSTSVLYSPLAHYTLAF